MVRANGEVGEDPEEEEGGRGEVEREEERELPELERAMTGEFRSKRGTGGDVEGEEGESTRELLGGIGGEEGEGEVENENENEVDDEEETGTDCGGEVDVGEPRGATETEDVEEESREVDETGGVEDAGGEKAEAEGGVDGEVEKKEERPPRMTVASRGATEGSEEGERRAAEGLAVKKTPFLARVNEL